MLAHECFLHTLLCSCFQTQPLSLHLKLTQRSHLHEIQICYHFSCVSSFCNNLVFSLCHNQVHMLFIKKIIIIKYTCYMLHLFMLGPFLPQPPPPIPPHFFCNYLYLIEFLYVIASCAMWPMSSCRSVLWTLLDTNLHLP